MGMGTGIFLLTVGYLPAITALCCVWIKLVKSPTDWAKLLFQRLRYLEIDNVVSTGNGVSVGAQLNGIP
jgi:hypothetical protein